MSTVIYLLQVNKRIALRLWACDNRHYLLSISTCDDC